MEDSQRNVRPEQGDTPSQRAYDRAHADDLRFLRAWEQGLFPMAGATVRVRQIRRALAAPPRAGMPKS